MSIEEDAFTLTAVTLLEINHLLYCGLLAGIPTQLLYSVTDHMSDLIICVQTSFSNQHITSLAICIKLRSLSLVSPQNKIKNKWQMVALQITVNVNNLYVQGKLQWI